MQKVRIGWIVRDTSFPCWPMRAATDRASKRHRAVGALTCAALLAWAAGVPTSTSFGAVRARISRSLRAVDSAHLHRARCSCNEILEEGEAEGSLPGRVRAYVTVGAPIVFRFTITVRGGGTLSGEGSGKPKGNPADPSFAGTMKVTRGTGRYRHAHGTGGFYGTLNRSTYTAVMQTTGTLSY
jgi:hypothetical protein